jgi:uncharacterized protein YjbI with pentapeptide repeats
MSEAFYYKGFTIEYDTDYLKPRLSIDGQKIKITQRGTWFVATKMLTELKKQDLYQLAKLVIKHLPGFKEREEIKKKHEEIVKKGVTEWNQWREENLQTRPLLYDAILNGRNLSNYNFSNANLICAKLRHAKMIGVNFHEANIGGADLLHANLTGANFCRTDLYKTKLRQANLTDANLQGTQLAKTNFKDAHLSGCKVYGMSAWDLVLDRVKQRDFVVRYESEDGSRRGGQDERIVVDDLETAQFLYFMLRNKNLRKMIDTLARQNVLILGRFTRKRKAVLDKLRDELRKRNFVPMIFDFEKPKARDLTETVSSLAHFSRFVIADISDAKSIPQELGRIVPSLRSLPIQPIIAGLQPAYGMFNDFGGYFSVLPLFRYKSIPHLLASLNSKIITPAVNHATQIEKLRTLFEHGLSSSVRKGTALLSPRRMHRKRRVS